MLVLIRRGLLDDARAGTPTAVAYGGMFAHHHGVGPDQAVVTDSDIAQHARSTANVHPILDRRDGRALLRDAIPKFVLAVIWTSSPIERAWRTIPP